MPASTPPLITVRFLKRILQSKDRQLPFVILYIPRVPKTIDELDREFHTDYQKLARGGIVRQMIMQFDREGREVWALCAEGPAGWGWYRALDCHLDPEMMVQALELPDVILRILEEAPRHEKPLTVAEIWRG